MCGLIGMFDFRPAGLLYGDEKTLFDMLLLNSVRGMDSVGLIGIDNKKNFVDILKVVGNPYDLLYWQAWEKFSMRTRTRYSGVIGHNRLATVGNITAKNAHPFVHGNITFVHNGTLRNYGELKKKHDLEFEVDSEAICYLINKIGIEETLKEIDGAYALIWHDRSDKTINVLRNTERPLKYTHQKYNPTKLYIASEEHVLAAALGRESFTSAWNDAKDFETNVLYTFSLSDAQCNFTKRGMLPFVKTSWGTGGASTKTGYHSTTGRIIPSITNANSSNKDFPKSPSSPPLSIPASSATTVCVGDEMHFVLDDATELNSKDNHNKTIIMVNGHHLTNSNISIRARFDGTMETIEEHLKEPNTNLICKGRIEDLYIDMESFKCNAYLEKADFIEKVKKPHFIQLKNTSITLPVWNRLMKNGCVRCHSELIYNLAPYLVYQHESQSAPEGILCKPCSEKPFELVPTSKKTA